MSQESFEEKQKEEDMVSETKSQPDLDEVDSSNVKTINPIKRDFALDDSPGVKTRTQLKPDSSERNSP